MHSLAQWPTVLAAFLASLVEFVEALTIVLAVGTVRGWRPALLGAGGAILGLALLVALFGPRLEGHNFASVQLVVGVLILLFGLRWLRKAILRAGGALALHDEQKAFSKETQALSTGVTFGSGFDLGATMTAFNGVFIEGIEVIFIVLGFGTLGGRAALLPACIGAGGAAGLVIVLGIIARHPLTRVPENALKMAVGVLVSALGTLWTGEGMGLRWPGGVWAPVVLSMAYVAVAGLGTVLVRRQVSLKIPQEAHA